MKKIIVLFLATTMFFSLTACKSDATASVLTDSSKEESSKIESSEKESSVLTSSEETSSEEAPVDDGNLIINYTSVADGYIDHHLDFDFGIIKFPGFQCMDREVLLLPKGTVIMSDNSLAIYCYNTVKYYKDDQLEYSTYLSQSLGQTISPTKDVVPSSGTFVIKEDSIVRFSVRGKLSDVKIFPSKGNEDKVRLMNEIDCINECFK